MDTPETTGTPTPEKKVASHQLRLDVAAALVNSGSTVRDIVVGKLTQAEIDRRTEAVMAVLTTIETKTNELRKLQKEGVINYTLSGDPTGVPSYTKPQLEAIKKVTENIDKLQSALDKAFTSSDFTKLLEVSKQS